MISWPVVAVSMVVLGCLASLTIFLVRHKLRRRLHRATNEFRILAEPLCLKFRELAAASGKPRGLRWKRCDYGGEEVFAVDRKNGAFCAFVSVLISFEVIEGGPMEDAQAAGDLRAATAVFIYRNGKWTTEGRVLFNLSPAESVERFGEALEPWTKQL